MRELRPAVLEQPDLAEALSDLAREWRIRHPNIGLTLEVEGDLGDLGEAVTLAVFRSAQEALTNVLKHAGASRVRLEVTRRNGRLETVVENDDSDLSESLAGSGHGLVGMRERIVALGGRLEAGKGPTGGFCVRIVLPLPRDIV